MRDFNEARGDIVIPASRIKLLGLLAICIAFTLVGALIIAAWLSRGQPLELLPVFGVLSLLLGVLLGGWVLFGVFVPKPAVALTNEGIYDAASLLSAGFVPWEEIEFVFVYKQQNQAFLGVMPKDVPAFLDSRGRLKQLALRASLRMGAPPIAIPQVVLPMSVQELAYEISARFPVRVE